MQRFLVATDLSERSNRAVRRAGILARELKASLMLLHVVDDDRPEPFVSSEITSAQQLLDATAVTVLKDVKCETIVELGDPFDGISRVAKGRGVDLIVMGAHRKQLLREIFVLVVLATHGRTGLLKFLLGSVTEEVMARLDRDVLVVPPRPQDKSVRRDLPVE